MGGVARATDPRLLENVGRGSECDEVVLAPIVAAYHEDMRRVCAFVARDEALAEDAVQAAWAIAWRKLGTLRDPDRLRPWLVSVAVNETRKLLKKRQRRPEVELSPKTDRAVESADPASAIDALDLRAALDRLGPEDRALLAMRYGAGFNATELSVAIGLSPSGTRNRLERLLGRLRRELTDG